MNARELRIGNFVTIDNPSHSRFSGIAMEVIGVNLNTDKSFPKSTGSVSLRCKAQVFNQFDEFVKPIKLTEVHLEKAGFKLHKYSHHDFIGVRDTYDKSKSVKRLDKLYRLRTGDHPFEASAGDMDVLVILDPETNKIRSIGVDKIRRYAVVDLQYVHQLQNTYFALKDEELTFN